MNVQVVTDPVGEILWLSLALSGRTHDLTAARTHKILRLYARQGVPILADMATSVRATASPPPSVVGPTANSPSPSRPRTGLCPRPGHLSNEAWHG